MGKEYFSIGEVSRETGIPPHTLRYWEKLGLLKPEIIEKRRKYTPREIERIKTIQNLLEEGYSLRRIKEKLRGRRKAQISPFIKTELAKIEEILERVIKILEG